MIAVTWVLIRINICYIIILGACLIVFGLIGSGIMGLYVEKTKKFKLSITLCSLVFMLSNVLLIGALYTENLYLSLGAIMLLGI